MIVSLSVVEVCIHNNTVFDFAQSDYHTKNQQIKSTTPNPLLTKEGVGGG